MANLLDVDEYIFLEKQRKFRGCVKISLDNLRPEDNTRAPRQLNEAGVTRLLNRFTREGCIRRDPQHYVPVLISHRDLPSNYFRVDAVANASKEDPKDPPVYCPHQTLVFLAGQYRLEAARRFLIPGEQWWIVNLYSDDLSPQAQDALRCADAGATKYSEGDIFRQIRISKLSNDEERRQRWLAKLNKNQQYNVSRLNAMPEFLASLDSKISLVGLWAAVTMSVFAWYSRIHCPEELTRYSDLITKSWTYIMGKKEEDHLHLDAGSVQILEGRCPYRSSEDKAYIQAQVQAGNFLPAVTSPHRRAEILNRVYSVPHLIPSFHTLHEDSKALEPPMTILRKFLPLPHERSTSQQFAALHSSQEKLTVQTSEFTFEELPTLSASSSSWASYRQLALAAFRHFPVMGGTPPRIDNRGKRLLECGEQKSWWCEVFALGSRLGYKRLVPKYPDRKAANVSIIRDCLHRTQPARYYVTDSQNDNRVVQLIGQVLVDKPRRTQTMLIPEIVSDVDDCGWHIKHRCGRPYERSFQNDEGSLFYDYMYSTTYPSHGRYLTSFGIKRDMFHAFFGTMPDEFKAGLDNPTLQQSRQGDLSETNVTEDMNIEQALIRTSQPRAPVEAISTREYLVPGATFRNTQRRSSFTVASQYSMSPVETPGTAIVRSALDFSEFSVGPWISQAPDTRPEADIPFTDASRLLFHRRKASKSSAFTILSPTIDGRFRKRSADRMDESSMLTALNLSSRCYFVAQSNGKRLKMAAPVTILEKARSNRLHAVVTVRRQKVPELIKQFENQEESDEEL